MPIFQHVQKDVHVPESRKSHDREKDPHRESCGSEYFIDFRIPGMPHSTVEHVETNRKEKVRENVPIAPFIGKLESYTAHAEMLAAYGNDSTKQQRQS